MIIDKLLRLVQKQFRHFLVFPLCRLTTFLKSDTGYPIDYRTGMSYTRVHPEQFGIILSGRFSRKILPVIHIQRIIGV